MIQEMLPNLLIVGAMKSGTSTLAFHLGQHPDIFMVDHEVHFFDNDINYSKGISFYEKEFIDWKNEKIIGEKTPAYCLKSEYAERIANTVPNAKLIWIFRNPVDRTYSEYWHAVRKGNEKRTFEETILDRNGSILEPESSRYIERSLYYKHVQYFLDLFPKQNIYFNTFENFTINSQDSIKEILKFLDVEPNFKINPEIKKNEGFIPKNAKFQNILENLSQRGKKYFSTNGLIANIYRKIVRSNQKKTDGYPPMDINIRSKLYEYFQDKNHKLAKITGLDISIWQ